MFHFKIMLEFFHLNKNFVLFVCNLFFYRFSSFVVFFTFRLSCIILWKMFPFFYTSFKENEGKKIKWLIVWRCKYFVLSVKLIRKLVHLFYIIFLVFWFFCPFSCFAVIRKLFTGFGGNPIRWNFIFFLFWAIKLNENHLENSV